MTTQPHHGPYNIDPPADVEAGDDYDKIPVDDVLKTVDLYFDQIIAGAKRFELRKKAGRDFPFFVGEKLQLVEVDADGQKTGRSARVDVTSILRGPFPGGGGWAEWPGLREGWAILSISLRSFHNVPAWRVDADGAPS